MFHGEKNEGEFKGSGSSPKEKEDVHLEGGGKKKKHVPPANGVKTSLSRKIVSKMALITAGIFLLTILMAAFLSARALIQVNREKLSAAA